jgi:cell division control protein 6
MGWYTVAQMIRICSTRSLSTVSSTVAYRVYQYITDLLDVDKKSCDSYLWYMNEPETYNFMTSKKRGRSYGGGVHKEYAFVDDLSVVAETLCENFQLEQVGHDEASSTLW